MSNRKVNIFEIENLRNENGALRRAVDSKSAAIGILRTELEECQRERDEFRMMAETQSLSQPAHFYKTILPCPEKTHSAILSGSENTLAQLLSQSKEENKQIRQELTDLKCRLHDAQSDLKILRAEKSRKTDVHQSRLSIATSSQLAQQERELHIQQMEELSSKCQAQESDIRCLLEEREELIKERDEIRHKLHRLNHILNVLLSRDYLKNSHPRHRTVDLDAIITENRYLQQRMKQLDEEKSLAIANSSKYKSALENCRTSTNSLKLGTSDNLIMSPKQVSEFLKQYEGEVGENAEKDLKFLCIALVDALNQKSRAVKTQKAANKMLIERVADLERRLVCCGDDSSNHTKTKSDTNLVSVSLMEGYNPSAVAEVENLDVTNIIQEIESDYKKEGLVVESKKQPPEPHQSELSKNDTSTEVNCFKGEEKDAEVVKEGKGEADAPEENECITVKLEQSRSTRETIEKLTQSSSDSEEIVPLENLDSYISNLKQKRTKRENSKEKDTSKENPTEPEDVKQNENGISSVSLGEESRGNSSDTSFDIDISDYDSDDNNLEETLQNWQSECEKASCGKIMSKLSPKRSVPGLLKRSKSWKEKKIELPDKLREILN